jgi:hypothetical protein
MRVTVIVKATAASESGELPRAELHIAGRSLRARRGRGGLHNA